MTTDIPITSMYSDDDKSIGIDTNTSLTLELKEDANIKDSLEIVDEPHVQQNITNEHDRSTDSVTTSTTQLSTNAASQESIQEHVMKFEPTAEVDQMADVEPRLQESSDTITSTTTQVVDNSSCFNCSYPVNTNNNPGYVIRCQSNHIYCFFCLRKSMNEFLTSFSTPACHSKFCDYQLSRHDLCCIPLERSTFRCLVALVKNQRRPKCFRCQFYIDLNNISDLDEHIESCNPENMIPCEYCHCPQEITNFNKHLQQCQNDPAEKQKERLISFILPRTQYPFNANQIEVFIKLQQDNNLPLHPLFIVESLAHYDAFPFETPSHHCNICLELCPYYDIFVYGCNNNHKLCYRCYEQSCTTQMNNNQILTCGLCSYQLSYNELKQLQVSPVQRDLFVEYQMERTFDRYAQGMIKCPNRNCTWAVETSDPDKPICVVCELCANEFCSLCNQQYHYRTNCRQVTEITQQWFFWCDSARGHYLAERARADTAAGARLAEYERQRPENNQRNEELRRQYGETMADEAYKASHCRLCPHCDRVVEHMGGCSSMICGRDYHGGNAQSGCGRNFTWNQARPYVAAVSRELEEFQRQLPNPNSQIIVHNNMTCDSCQEIVHGILFECIHCPRLIYCENCEPLCTLIHWNEHRQEGKQQHIFRLITTPST